MSVSVVIPTRDRPHALKTCVDAILCQTMPVREVVVVDSAPRHADARDVVMSAGVRYVALERAGASRARNVGARRATGEIVLFFDDDAVPAPDCVAAIAREFEDTAVVAVAGRTLLSTTGPAAELYESFGGFDVGPARRVIELANPDWFELVNFGGIGAGAVMAFRRSAFDAWAGFDERLGRGAPQDCNEEPYAYFHWVERGFKVVYTPSAIVVHPAPRSIGQLRSRLLRDAAWSSAYMCLLFAEHPRHRRRIVRYALEALRGQRRTWRPRPAEARYAVIPRWRELAAWALGPLLYLRMRVLTLHLRAEARQ